MNSVDSSFPASECSTTNGSDTDDGFGQKLHQIPETPLDPSSVAEEPFHVFSNRQKAWIVTLISISATFSPLSSNIYFPALDAIADNLGVNNQVVNLSITTYMIAQGITPSFWGPLADIYGRRQILIYTLILYICANIGLALSQNAAMLLVFRFLQAAGSSSTISLGAGVISDIATPAERGGYLGYFSGARQFSLALGPVLGGLLGGTLGFRSIFWFLVVLSSAATILIILCLPETMRNIAGNGSWPLKSWAHKPLLEIFKSRQNRRKNPLSLSDGENAVSCEEGSAPLPKLTIRNFYSPLLLLLEKDVACALFYGACVYTSWSMVTASTNFLLQHEYDLDTLLVGVCFLANGLGCIAGSVISGRILNDNFHREVGLYHHNNELPKTTSLPKDPLPSEFPLEQARLGDAPVYTAVCIMSSLIYGWSMTPLYGAEHVSVSLVVPLLAMFAIGYSATAVLNSNNTLVVDLFPNKGASATAVNNLARCSLGAVGVGVVDSIIDYVGAGWLGVILAGLVAVGYISVQIEWIKGHKWRAERNHKRPGLMRHLSRQVSEKFTRS